MRLPVWHSIESRRCISALLLIILQSLANLLRVEAHSASTGFLRLQRADGMVRGQLELPLRDLDDMLGLDADDDGQLTWGELRSHEADLRHYVASRLVLSQGETAMPCQFDPILVTQRQQESYGVFNFSTAAASAPGTLRLDYRVLFEHDPLHRCLVIVPAGGASAVMTPEHPGLLLPESGSPSAGLASFVANGTHHIWTGYDHLLFLFALLLPSVLRRTETGWTPALTTREVLAEVLKVVTAFTVAHSVTLTAATLGFIHLPSRLVESTIAASIIIAAAANLIPVSQARISAAGSPRRRALPTWMRPWMVAFAFGLVHGFGFAGVLSDLGLRRGQMGTPLIGFNVGVELGQLACVAAFLPLALWFRKASFYRAAAVPIGSAVIILLAGGWLVERAFDVGFMPF